MTLTPEDIVNKRFQSSKLLREGYDQDEVDDFLDEIVVAMRAIIAERDALKQRLESADAPAVDNAVAAPVPAAPAAAPSTQDVLDETQSSNNMLVLARRLHDEHVREGIEKRDALIAEAHENATRIISDAENTANEQITAYNIQIADLETKVTELRAFETEYRRHLRSYIEGQLKDLDKSSSAAD